MLRNRPHRLNGQGDLSGPPPHEKESSEFVLGAESPQNVSRRSVVQFLGTLAGLVVLGALARRQEIEKILTNMDSEMGLRRRDAARAKEGRAMLLDVRRTDMYDDDFILKDHRCVIHAEVGERYRQWSATYHADAGKRYTVVNNHQGLSSSEDLLNKNAKQWDSRSIDHSKLPAAFQNLLRSNRLEPQEDIGPDCQELIQESLAAIRRALASPEEAPRPIGHW